MAKVKAKKNTNDDNNNNHISYSDDGDSITWVDGEQNAKDGEKPLKLFQIKLLAQTVALVASVFYTNF